MSEQKVYDVPEVLAALEAAVAKRGGGYVYKNPCPTEGMPACLYTHKSEDGILTPGCIVGQVYFDLTGTHVPWGSEDQDGIVRKNAHTRQAFTTPALVILSEAQKRQDGFAPWGEALAAAKAKALEV